MRFRHFFLTALLASLCLPAKITHAAASHPNVLLIMTDDQGWGDVHANGNPLVDTPTMDRLKAEGVSFERFYVSPVCAPTRSSLLSGRYHLRTGVSWVTHRREVMHADEVTMAEIFKQAGYATACFGKWHNGEQFPNDPNGQGFDEFFGFCAGHWNGYFDPELQHNSQTIKTKGFITDILTDAALKWLDKNKSHPFFCYVPYNAPHTPWQVPDKYFNKYKARGLEDEVAAAYGLVQNADENIARLLKKLEELKLVDDTIVIFLTDNGPNGTRYNGDMKGKKASVHEGGVRVPFFIRWPGRLPHHEVKQIAAHIDVLPTLVELCGLSMPKTLPLDGRSLVPLLKGEKVGWPDRMLFTHQAGVGKIELDKGAVRTQQYRLVREKKKYQLYDMLADPGEKKDVAKAHPDIVARLSKAYEDWFAVASKPALNKTPVPVGFPGHDVVDMSAPGAGFSGNVDFYNKPGYAHDWLTGWKSKDDRIWWDLEVANGGRYEVILQYACPQAKLGSIVQAEASGHSVTKLIDKAFDKGVVERQERATGKEARMMREFGQFSLGTIELPAGTQRLTLSAREVKGDSVAEIGGVTLRRVK